MNLRITQPMKRVGKAGSAGDLLLCNGRAPKKCEPEKLLITYSHCSKIFMPPKNNLKKHKKKNTQKQQIRSHQTWISQVRTVRTASLSTTPCTVPSSAGDPQDSEVLLARIDVKLSWFKGWCTSLNKNTWFTTYMVLPGIVWNHWTLARNVTKL